jgi:hypothetical protein
MYGWPADTERRLAEFRAFVREVVAMADANLDAASSGVDGQHYRFYCIDGKKVAVQGVKLLPIGDDGSFSFQDLIDSLENRVDNGLGSQNHDLRRYIYAVFVDNVAGAYGPAGQATLYWDDSPDPATNLNNLTNVYRARYSMIRLGFSATGEAGIFQHEVGHNIGAVQNSAPHSSRAGHCYDDSDVMCYEDGGPWFSGGGTMQSVCPKMPDGQEPWDCLQDDYYSPQPEEATYLATHWNTADSGWLTRLTPAA